MSANSNNKLSKQVDNVNIFALRIAVHMLFYYQGTDNWKSTADFSNMENII